MYKDTIPDEAEIEMALFPKSLGVNSCMVLPIKPRYCLAVTVRLQQYFFMAFSFYFFF